MEKNYVTAESAAAAKLVAAAEFCRASAAFGVFNAKPLLLVILRFVSPMWHFRLQSYERLKKKIFYPTKSQPEGYCNSGGGGSSENFIRYIVLQRTEC